MSVNRENLLPALESVRGCLKATSMLWMHALGLPVLSGVIVSNWSRQSSAAVHGFCRKCHFSELLLRIDKRHDRWSSRRGGYLVPLAQVPATVKELQQEGRIAILLEPASPYVDQYSLAGVTIPEHRKIVVEVVGPGFDASDILRADLSAHERWELELKLATSGLRSVPPLVAERIQLATFEQYTESIQVRLAKIGARIKNPAFPDSVLKTDAVDTAELREAGASFLKTTNQTALLKHANVYVPIPKKHLMAFARYVQTLLYGLASYGIHLGPSSFAASVLPKRGLTLWDFFPARKQEAAFLYPAH